MCGVPIPWQCGCRLARHDGASLEKNAVPDARSSGRSVPAKGTKPVEWSLLTNRSAPTLDDVIELIDWYRARWEVEIYFDVLENGCKVEAL